MTSGVLVAFRQGDGIWVGHAVLAINGVDVNSQYMTDGKKVLEYLGNPANYPLLLTPCSPRFLSCPMGSIVSTPTERSQQPCSCT
uniref:Uncharacterized protein n=1 Tax=Sciurus vulgaris TaxID=55149 RepID=A0A8D2DRZ7_SCIVU